MLHRRGGLTAFGENRTLGSSKHGLITHLGMACDSEPPEEPSNVFSFGNSQPATSDTPTGPGSCYWDFCIVYAVGYPLAGRGMMKPAPSPTVTTRWTPGIELR